MKAAVLTAHYKIDFQDIPEPEPKANEVKIKVHSAGICGSELHAFKGTHPFRQPPAILGHEMSGEIVATGAEIKRFKVGDRVTVEPQLLCGVCDSCRSGHSNLCDNKVVLGTKPWIGGYAEYVRVPASIVVPFVSDLPWDVLGAVPEMLQTAHGSLQTGVRATPGQTLLVRGGTSAVGLTLAVLGRLRGLRVLSTTRSRDHVGLIERVGATPLLDDGDIEAQLGDDRVDGAVELVGVDTLRDTLRATRPGGTVCLTGMLSDHWTVSEFSPMEWLPNGVRLTAYAGEATDLPPTVLQEFLDAVADGRAEVPVGRVYSLDQIVQAHRDMEAGVIGGKGVVVL